MYKNSQRYKNRMVGMKSKGNNQNLVRRPTFLFYYFVDLNIYHRLKAVALR